MHQAVLDTFDLSEKTYRLNQLPYDLHKLKGHGLIERDGSRYAYRLSPKGVQVALLFLFFHKRLCGPLANSRPDPQHRPDSGSKPPITDRGDVRRKPRSPSARRMKLNAIPTFIPQGKGRDRQSPAKTSSRGFRCQID